MSSLRVVVADDDPLARALVSEIVSGAEDLELVGAAEDAPSAVALVLEHSPDVAVLDWMMPGGGGPFAAREIVQSSPSTSLVALTSSDGQEAEIDMLRAGAKSILVKGAAPDEIVRTIRAAVSF